MELRTHRFSLAVVVAVALVAALVGSAGTAAAGGLTSHAVKKIAAKVVKKKARKLSVANAGTLAGQPPSAYQNQAYVFTATVPAPKASADLAISLPPGSYLVSWSAHLTGAQPGDATCTMFSGSGVSKVFFAEDATDTAVFTTAVSGSGFVSALPGVPLGLHCAAQGSFTVGASEPIQVVATRVDLVSSTVVPAS